MPKICFKLKASKSKKSLKLLVVLVRLTYNIKTVLKRVLKTKAQFKGHLELKDIAIYTFYIKFKKTKNLVNILFIF